MNSRRLYLTLFKYLLLICILCFQGQTSGAGPLDCLPNLKRLSALLAKVRDLKFPAYAKAIQEDFLENLAEMRKIDPSADLPDLELHEFPEPTLKGGEFNLRYLLVVSPKKDHPNALNRYAYKVLHERNSRVIVDLFYDHQVSVMGQSLEWKRHRELLHQSYEVFKQIDWCSADQFIKDFCISASDYFVPFIRALRKRLFRELGDSTGPNKILPYAKVLDVLRRPNLVKEILKGFEVPDEIKNSIETIFTHLIDRIATAPWDWASLTRPAVQNASTSTDPLVNFVFVLLMDPLSDLSAGMSLLSDGTSRISVPPNSILFHDGSEIVSTLAFLFDPTPGHLEIDSRLILEIQPLIHSWQPEDPESKTTLWNGLSDYVGIEDAFKLDKKFSSQKWERSFSSEQKRKKFKDSLRLFAKYLETIAPAAKSSLESNRLLNIAATLHDRSRQSTDDWNTIEFAQAMLNVGARQDPKAPQPPHIVGRIFLSGLELLATNASDEARLAREHLFSGTPLDGTRLLSEKFLLTPEEALETEQILLKDFSGFSLNARTHGKLQPSLGSSQRFVRLYHATSTQNAETILKSGVNLWLGDGEFGSGFYTTPLASQAKAFINLKKETDPKFRGAVIIIDIDISEIEKIYKDDSRKYLDFPDSVLTAFKARPSLEDPDRDATPGEVFHFFVDICRANSDERLEHHLSLRGIDLLTGPSISSRGKFLNILFGDTPANRSLFDSHNPNIRMRILQEKK